MRIKEEFIEELKGRISYMNNVINYHNSDEFKILRGNYEKEISELKEMIEYLEEKKDDVS